MQSMYICCSFESELYVARRVLYEDPSTTNLNGNDCVRKFGLLGFETLDLRRISFNKGTCVWYFLHHQ